MKIDKIRSLFGYVKPMIKCRDIYSHCNITDRGIEVTDLETSLLITNNYGLVKGLQSIEFLGLKEVYNAQVDEYPVITWDLKNNESVGTSLKVLSDLVDHASDDKYRIYLRSLYFEKNKIVATNGYHLRHETIDNELKESYLIPKKSIEILIKLLKGFKVEKFFIDFNSDFATVKLLDFTWQARLIKRDFLKWKAVLPKSTKINFYIESIPKYKDVKMFLNKRTNAVKMQSENGVVKLIFIEEPHEIIIGECSEDFEVGFNYKFLELGVKSELTKIGFNSSYSPVMFNDNIIIMPLKL